MEEGLLLGEMVSGERLGFRGDNSNSNDILDETISLADIVSPHSLEQNVNKKEIDLTSEIHDNDNKKENENIKTSLITNETIIEKQIITKIQQEEIYKKYQEINNKMLKRLLNINNLNDQSIIKQFGIKIKILQKWRYILRENKLEEMRKEWIPYLDYFYNNKILTLNNNSICNNCNDINILELNIKYNMTNQHFKQLKELLNIHQNKINEYLKEFEKDLEILKNEFNYEKQDMINYYIKFQKQIQILNELILKEFEQVSDFEKQNFESEREEIKNKNLEDLNVLKITLETEIEVYEKQFDECHDQFIELTKDKNKEFIQLKKKDEHISNEIKRLIINNDILHNECLQLKKKLIQNKQEWLLKNDLLKKEKQEMNQHFVSLKNRLNKFRKNENNKLSFIISEFNKNEKELRNLIDIANSIFKLYQIQRKYQLQQEQIYTTQQITNIPEYSIYTSNISQDKIHLINHFMTKYNKALIDFNVISETKKSLLAENYKLKQLLNQYFDCIAVDGGDTTNKSHHNTLLLINKTLGVIDIKDSTKRLIIDGNTVFRQYCLQGYQQTDTSSLSKGSQ
ncbi:flagellar associated protein [Reticulomyxa filosa]|uniref:Flagellar associated protein n=1 Tax=Reticulomyxa filosa TaxID=46433 RepID=X6LSB1_RETFI|nr:flagellar associated protein [Reticulomyxa filosa]|eukprot:ETO04519.1 flagellar associated protein [Reticulomyxa filosa]